jgi:hypothetical protein
MGPRRARIASLGLAVVAAAAALWIAVRAPEAPEAPEAPRDRAVEVAAFAEPAPARPAPSAALVGRVTRGGRPTAAVVTVRPWTEPPAVPAAPLATLGTDGGGAFTAPGLPAGEYEVAATAEDGARGRTRVPVPVNGARVAVEVAVDDGDLALRGRAAWRDGRPFCGLVAAGNGPSVECGPDGRFAFTGLRPGPVWLVFALPGRFRTSRHDVSLPRDDEVVLVVDEGFTTLTGRVLEMPARSPVPGACLEALFWGPGGGLLKSAAVTDESGRFSVDAGDGEVTVGFKAPGFAPQERSVPAGTRDVEFLVIPGARLSCAVVSAKDRAPVADVEVSLSYGAVTVTARTDAAGRALFEAAPCGDVYLRARNDEWFSGLLRVSLAPRVAESVEIPVRRAAAVAGRVVDARKEAVPGAVVRARQDDRSTFAASDARGDFVVRGLAPDDVAVLSAEAPGLPHTEAGPVFPRSDGTSFLEIRLPDPRWLLVTVLDAVSGEPVEGAWTHVTDEHHSGGWWEKLALGKRTGADGTTRLGPLPGGPLGLVVQHKDHVDLADPGPLDLPEARDGTLSTTVRLDRGATISGRVLLPDGSPATDGEVHAQGSGPWGEHFPLVNGGFVLRGIAPGWHRLHARVNVRGRDLWQEGGARAGDADVTIVVKDVQGASDLPPLFARLSDPRGRPVLWARVSTTESRVPVEWAWFTPPGELRVDGYLLSDPHGRMLVVAGARSVDGEPLGCALLGPITLEGGPLSVRLPPEESIEGFVRSAGGAPLPGVLVTAAIVPPEEIQRAPDVSGARTDAEGRFRLGGLCPGEFLVRAGPAAGCVAPEPVPVRSGATGIEIVMVEGATVRLTFLDWQDRPVQGVSVRAGEDLDLGEAIPVEWVLSDPEGVAVLTSLVAGDGLSLFVRPPKTREDLGRFERIHWRPADETFRFERRTVIAGVVRDEEGRPVVGAKVEIRQGKSGRRRSATSGRDGRFRSVGLPEGEFLLSVRVGSAGPSSTGVENLAVAAGTEDLVLTIRRPRD